MSYFKRLVGGGLQHVGHMALSAVPARSVTILRCGMLRVTLKALFVKAHGSSALACKLA
jgi:hypothetical protein